ncbi:MAG: multidrug effflux MFS transporter [Rickettsiaceae bacterium]|nr:multidrug effflux MFS transporter [Rickettsiaceae bacterium]
MTETLSKLPPIWLIVLLAGLSTLSETIYIPSLPDIAVDLRTSESMVEHTLTIYLIGFTFGILFWGNLSDKIGRKPCVIYGLSIYIMGCIGCYFSSDIQTLMLCRFVQSFGGSIGSVLGQSITRDAFLGSELAKVYATVSTALAIFPAIGPIIGGNIAQNFAWNNIFLFLIIFAVIFIILVVIKLPETNKFRRDSRASSLLKVALRISKDFKVIGLGFIVAICNGLVFSYCAEGPFYLMKTLGLSSSEYGLSFVAIAASIMLGGFISKKLHKKAYSSKAIMTYGINIILLFSIIFSIFILAHSYVVKLPLNFLIGVTISSQMMINLGICMTSSNALTLALQDYRDITGRASSIFGCFYYFFTSLFTFIMGALHNGSLITMPIYFLVLACFMLIFNKIMCSEI